MKETQSDPFEVAPYSCGHQPEGVCDGCLDARLSERAIRHEYALRVVTDGDELRLPLRIHSGKDYSPGERLDAVAARVASDLLRMHFNGVCDRIDVYVSEVADGDCLGDSEPVQLAHGEAIR